MLTDEISDADRERDQLLSGYRAAVKGFRNVSVLAMADAAKVLWQNLKDYKIDPSMQLERETGLINNLIDDCEKKYAAQVTQLSLTPYVTVLKAANAKVESLLVQRTEIKSTQVLGALRLARLQSDAAYRLLVKIVNPWYCCWTKVNTRRSSTSSTNSSSATNSRLSPRRKAVKNPNFRLKRNRKRKDRKYGYRRYRASK